MELSAAERARLKEVAVQKILALKRHVGITGRGGDGIGPGTTERVNVE